MYFFGSIQLNFYSKKKSLGFWVLKFRVLGFRVLEFRILGLWGSGSGCRVRGSGVGFRV